MACDSIVATLCAGGGGVYVDDAKVEITRSRPWVTDNVTVT